MGIEFTHRKERPGGYPGLDGFGKIHPASLPVLDVNFPPEPLATPDVNDGWGPGYGGRMLANLVIDGAAQPGLGIPFTDLFIPGEVGMVDQTVDYSGSLFNWSPGAPDVLLVHTPGWYQVTWQIQTSVATVDAQVQVDGAAFPTPRRLATSGTISVTPDEWHSMIAYLDGGVKLRVWRGSVSFIISYALLLLVPL
jgi:hypothetical protein